MNLRLFTILIFASSFIVTSFSDNSEEEMDMDMDNVSVNITSEIVGKYIGLNTFGEGGSFINESNRIATVTMASDSVVNVTVATAFGSSTSIVGNLNNESQFDAEEATVLGETGYFGTGELRDDSLFINLTLEDQFYNYSGPRQ